MEENVGGGEKQWLKKAPSTEDSLNKVDESEMGRARVDLDRLEPKRGARHHQTTFCQNSQGFRGGEMMLGWRCATSGLIIRERWENGMGRQESHGGYGF
jgi:hypothetical protein